MMTARSAVREQQRKKEQRRRDNDALQQGAKADRGNPAQRPKAGCFP